MRLCWGPIFQRRWLWVPATESPRRKRRGVPHAGTTSVELIISVSPPPFGRQTFSLGAGEVAQLPLAHTLHHLPRSALEAFFRALAALGGQRRARGHLLFLRSRRHGLLLNAAAVETSKLPVQAKNVQRVRKFRTEGNNVRRLSRRRLDRRRAIGAPLRHAVVEPTLLEHRIGKPNPPAHHEDEEKQQHGVGDPALTRGLDVFILLGLLWLVHAQSYL